MPDEPNRRRLQFTLRTLLFAALCVCGLLAGYRFGFERGYREGTEKWQQEKMTARVYPVADLVMLDDRWPQPTSTGPPLPDFDSLIDLLTSTVAPTSWDAVGGPGSIAPHLQSMSVVIYQAPSLHAEIEKLLSDLRQAKKQGVGIQLAH